MAHTRNGGLSRKTVVNRKVRTDFGETSSIGKHPSLPMNSIRDRVLRSEPFFINTQIFFLAGFGYVRDGNRWTSFFYGIYRFFCFFSITVTAVIQIVDVYLLLDDFEKLAQDLCAIFVTFVVTIKMYAFSFRTHLIEELQGEIIRFRESHAHPEEEEIWGRASWRVKAMTKTFYLMGTSCVIFWISFPALDNASGRNLPYPWLFPVDPYRSPYYEIIYLFQSLALFSFLINIVSIDLGYCSYIVLIVAQYEVLGRNIRNISSAYDGDSRRGENRAEKSMKALKESIQIHNNIFSQIRKLQAIHSDFLFLQMSVMALMLATVIVDTIVNSRGVGLRLIQRVLYTFSACFDAWIICYWGTQLRQKSYDFADEIYNSSWIKMDAKVRKIMLMIMMKAQRAPRLQNGILFFELPLFLEIMHYAYNAMALLNNMK